jgi:four helix bundle protein
MNALADALKARVAANYHAACRARSRRDFVAKLGIVTEEAEGTLFWLAFAERAQMIRRARVKTCSGKGGNCLPSSPGQQ